jgi:CyaY protein
MNESEYHRVASATIARIEEAVEDCGVDIDYELVSDILTLTFANDTQIIVNKQSAARQIWVAAKSGGFHYDYDEPRGVWVDGQRGEELFAALSRMAGEQAGEPVKLG